MSGGLLSLKWNNHQSTFLHVLSSLCLNDTLSDVTLACEGEFFAAHKLVLATCSEYFEKIFEKIEGKHSVIVLRDVKAEELEALLSYMYEGEVNVLQEKLSGLINAAEYLKIKGLSDSDDAPKHLSKRSFKSQQKDRISPCEEISLSPPAKRKRQDSENCEIAFRRNSSPEPNSNAEKEQVQEGIVDEPHFSRETDESSSKPEDEILDLDRIKDEPSELELKNEVPFAFSNESSQLLNTQSDYYPQISDGSLPSISSLPEKDMNTQRMPKESSAASSNAWETGGGLSNLLNSNRQATFDAISSFPSLRERGRPPELISWPSPALPFAVSSSFIAPLAVPSRSVSSSTAKKNKVCNVCSKSFLFESHLRKHHLVHTGETPFACTMCSYRANRRENLNRHIRNHKKINRASGKLFGRPY